MKTITVPNRLNLARALEFGARLNQLPGGVDYNFDFSKLRFVGPLGLVYISSCIEDLCERCPDNEPNGEGFEQQSYAAHMGFFKIFDLDFGNSPGQAAGSNRYIPITILDGHQVRRDSAASGEAIGSIIEKESQRVAAVLCQEVDGDIHDTLAFAIREILRNAVEHSHSQTVRYCAQFYPTQDRVEVVILDKGRGIKESFVKNPFIQPDTHRNALNYALLPGVSGTAFKGSKINSRKDEWKNSGYGLYMTNKICRSGGDFFIASGNSGILLEQSKKSDFSISHAGTLLRLTIRPSRVANLNSRLLAFSEDGKIQAAKIKGTVVTPSTASQMLTLDYREG